MKLLMSGAVVATLTALGTAGSVAAPTSMASVPTITAGPALDRQASLARRCQQQRMGGRRGDHPIQLHRAEQRQRDPRLSSRSCDDRVSGLVPSSVDAIFPAAALIFLPAIYTVTAEDVASGEIINVATATGIAPGGVAVESEPDTTSTPTAPQIPMTGTSPVALIASTVLLAALGAGLIILSRRRRAP